MSSNFIKLTAILFLMASGLSAKTFEVDVDHTHIGFKIKHLVISNVEGRFTTFKGSFTTDDKTNALTGLEGTAVASSINTGNDKRDEHLRSPDFFDAKKFPEIKFVADKFNIAKGATGNVSGNLTMHGVTKPVTFVVEWRGDATDPWGNKKAALTATIEKLNRKDFGLNWNKALEAGGVLVGDEVKVTLEIEGGLKAEVSEKETKASKK